MHKLTLREIVSRYDLTLDRVIDFCDFETGEVLLTSCPTSEMMDWDIYGFIVVPGDTTITAFVKNSVLLKKGDFVKVLLEEDSVRLPSGTIGIIEEIDGFIDTIYKVKDLYSDEYAWYGFEDLQKVKIVFVQNTLQKNKKETEMFTVKEVLNKYNVRSIDLVDKNTGETLYTGEPQQAMLQWPIYGFFFLEGNLTVSINGNSMYPLRKGDVVKAVENYGDLLEGEIGVVTNFDYFYDALLYQVKSIATNKEAWYSPVLLQKGNITWEEM